MSQTVTTRPSQSSQRKFRNFWINPRFQARYIFWITLTGVFLVALQSAVFYVFTRENYAILVDMSPMTLEAQQQLYSELRRIIALLVLVSLVFIALVAFVGVIFSHRTAGPLYHFKRVFEAVKGGDLSARVHLRPNDEFQDVARAFNEMMDTVKKG